jgi:hypothetical protein
MAWATPTPQGESSLAEIHFFYRISGMMSDSASSRSVALGRGRFGLDAVVAGLSLAASVVFAMLWLGARQEVGSLQERIAPLREETERYRAGLREEVLRTHHLTEDLKAARGKTASTP